MQIIHHIMMRGTVTDHYEDWAIISSDLDMVGVIGTTGTGVTMTTMSTFIKIITATGTTMVAGELVTAISGFGSASKAVNHSTQERAHSEPFLLFCQALS